MMIGSTVSIPYDEALLWLLVALAGLLLVGAITSPDWSPGVGLAVRRGALLLAAGATAFVLLRTPSNDPFIGLGRLFTVWCPLVVIAVLFVVWSWRAGRW